MNILLVGSEGSIGRRYQAVFRALSCPVVRYDPVKDSEEPDLRGFEKALICAPTGWHWYWATKLLKSGIEILCEKPLAKTIRECKEIIAASQENSVKGYVVNNWVWALNPTTRSNYFPLSYNYFNAGKDEESILWDCSQLVYLNPQIEIRTESPVWNVKVRYRRDVVLMDYRDLEKSYLMMIDHWVNGDGSDLWTLEDGLRMTMAVLERMKHDSR